MPFSGELPECRLVGRFLPPPLSGEVPPDAYCWGDSFQCLLVTGVFSQLSHSANASDENILEWNPENERTGGYFPPPVHWGGLSFTGTGLFRSIILASVCIGARLTNPTSKQKARHAPQLRFARDTMLCFVPDFGRFFLQ